METALALLTLFNAASPGIASLILLIKRDDGKISVVALLDEADAKFSDNISKAKKWLESH